jgi:hypothetical protein
MAAGVVSSIAAAPQTSNAGGAGAPTEKAGRAYLILQRTLSVACLCSMLMMLAATRPDAPGLLLLSWALFGAAQGPVGPVALEQAAWMTWPVAADSSSAALFIISNLVSFAQTQVMQALLNSKASRECNRAVTPTAAFLAVQMLTGCLAAFSLSPRAAAMDRAEGAALEGGGIVELRGGNEAVELLSDQDPPR